MANSTAAYRYRPLCPSSDEIRLLTLDPGLDDDEISCTLNHYNLTNNPKYEALSYTWGDTTNEGRITVDGRPFVVSANLETALRYLRYPVPSSVPGTEIPPPNNEPCGKRTIWIDAICVDQENSKERSQQIRKMDKIFGSALKVLAWLGSARDESDSAMDFVKRIANGLGLFGVDGEPLIPENTWIALQKLWARPYWERVWIIQELAAAMAKGEMQFLPRYRAEVGCGRMWVPLDDFQLAWDRLNFYINISGLGVDDRTDPARHLFELLLQHSQKGHTLSSLISLTYTAKATDNRDHFYAVLGLAPEADREDLYPDYAKLFPEINGRFLKRIIEKEMKLDILAFDHSSQAPIWAPNFESISRSARIRWRKYWGGFQASGRNKGVCC
ncbi:heterokaryon incompatibility protein-domain-containing protein [Ustulina deusta]|nr:heterokaryon incompatibility protein-domain-containing protein [Ustulina deusta]